MAKQESDYTVKVSGVTEVIVRGDCDPEYWRARLAPYSLFPHRAAGATELAFGAARFRFKGILIRELYAAVNVSLSADGETQHGVFFICGLHGSRLFAWMERSLMKTAYYHAPRLRIEHEPGSGLAEVEIGDRSGTYLHAQRLASSEPSERVETTWQGPIFLPGRPEKAHLFYASLGGPTAIYPFEPQHDKLTLPPADHRLGAIAESGFEPKRWLLRSAGRHGRSKTLPWRGNELAFTARETVAEAVSA